MSTLMVDIISKETIKPSSPTPPHLKTLKLSIIDQHEPLLFISTLVLFSAGPNVKPCAIIDRLKESLPETLTLFYPLAGRISDNHFIDCNDEGINLFETRVNTRLTRVLGHPIAEEMVELFPIDNFSGSGPKVLLSIQINIFDCGGIALGFRISHKVADVASSVFFINTWAATTGGGADVKIVPPKFGTASFFPPKQTDIPPIISAPYDTQAKLVCKRFVFNASNIAALRAKCSSKSYTPTRVEAVTALIWTCAMKAAKSDSSALMPAMNLRTRMDPPLPISYFGNIILGLQVTSTTKGTTTPDLECLVGALRQAISEIDGNYVRKLQVDDGVLMLYDSYREVFNELSLKGGVSYFGITSCCRFPLYEADFGWGKPDWVTIVNLLCENITILTDTKCGTGIEAWTTLDEKLMASFEHNPDLLAFTSDALAHSVSEVF